MAFVRRYLLSKSNILWLNGSNIKEDINAEIIARLKLLSLKNMRIYIYYVKNTTMHFKRILNVLK